MARDRMGVPHLVREDTDRIRATPLRRMPLAQKGSEIDEAWLQRLIHESPEVLPVKDVFARVGGRMVSLGREIPVPTGLIDNLILSSSGHLVVVETKLWRNPQARREVVAQVLDYAGYVRAWDYDKLNSLWRESGRTGSLHEAVAPEEDEASWVDSINDYLASGEMVLLVVGDGIESRAETLADVVGGRPDLQFRLALVELRLYRLEDGSALVVPSTLARTAEIERATVRVVYADGSRPEVGVTVPAPEAQSRSSPGSRTTLDAQALLTEIEKSGPHGKPAAAVVSTLLEELDAHGDDLVVEWKSSGFAVKTPDPVSEGAMLSLLVVSRPNSLYAYWGWIRDQVSKNWGDEAAGERIGDMLSAMMHTLGARRTHGGMMATVNISDLTGRESEVVEGLSKVVEAIRHEAEGIRGQS